MVGDNHIVSCYPFLWKHTIVLVLVWVATPLAGRGRRARRLGTWLQKGRRDAESAAERIVRALE